jgi:hypothetical protein
MENFDLNDRSLYPILSSEVRKATSTHLNEVRKVVVFSSADEARYSYAGEGTASCKCQYGRLL